MVVIERFVKLVVRVPGDGLITVRRVQEHIPGQRNNVVEVLLRKQRDDRCLA